MEKVDQALIGMTDGECDTYKMAELARSAWVDIDDLTIKIERTGWNELLINVHPIDAWGSPSKSHAWLQVSGRGGGPIREIDHGGEA